MEPVTHVLTGACLARTGLNRRAAYATAAMAIAAEFPDIDTVSSLRGPVSGFVHHRGMTHTFLGVPFEAALLVLVFVAWHRLRQRRGARWRQSAPVNWPMLFLLLCLALLSHLLLDFTNNYGLRPFLPFNDHWYAGSIVFIFDPLLFVLLLAGLTAPFLFSLVHREVGGAEQPLRGRGWAIAALLGVVTLWAVRTVEHGQAVSLAEARTLRAPATLPDDTQAAAVPASAPDAGQPAPEPQRALLQAQRSLANPDPLSIFRWYTVTDFGPVYQLGTADTRRATLVGGDLLPKPDLSSTVRAAEATALGAAYLSWSPMAVITEDDLPSGEAQNEGQGARVVLFRDPRFMGDTSLLHREGKSPLSGEVVLGQGGEILGQGMDGKLQRPDRR